MTVRLDRMASLSQQQLTKFIRGISLRQVRLACGLVLFAYLVSHFLNHALGNISMDALAAGLHYHKAFWQFLPVAIAFYTAAVVHAGLGIRALYERREFHWKAIEPIQLVYFTDRHYNPADELRLPYDHPDIAYDWETQHK